MTIDIDAIKARIALAERVYSGLTVPTISTDDANALVAEVERLRDLLLRSRGSAK